MSSLPSPSAPQVYSNEPNFLHVVLLASVALGLMLILAYIILVGIGDSLVPNALNHIQPAGRLALSTLCALAL